MSKKIEMGANIATIIAAVAVLGFFIHGRVSGSMPPHPIISAGVKLNVAGENWTQSEKTVVLAISATCHFCTESAGFYKDLVQQCQSKHLRTIALLPQSVADGNSYLDKLGVKVNEVRQESFQDLQIQGTPTLLLIDSRGIVTNVWVGKLPQDKESEVFKKLQSQKQSSSGRGTTLQASGNL